MFFILRVITKPLEPRLSYPMKLGGIFLTWTFAIGMTLPYTISQGLDTQYSICIDQGKLDPVGVNIYVMCWIVAGWGFPFCVIGLLYGLCICTLKKTAAAAIGNSTAGKRIAENKKVIKMFIIIVSLFFSLTTPYSIYYVTLNYMLTYRRSELDITVIMITNYVLFFLTTVNSCINPIIYARLHKDVNGYIKKKCKCVQRTSGERATSSYEVTKMTSTTKSTAMAAAHPVSKYADNKTFVHD